MYRTASFDAIGVTNQVTVTDTKALPTALSIAREEVAALDRACSRFRDDSELSALNHNPGRPVEVSPLLLDALEAGLAAAEATDGLVDPTVGAALRGLGYDRDFDVLVSTRPRPAFTLIPASGWRSVRVAR
jgi:thiamine biosynthesis lipoprotein